MARPTADNPLLPITVRLPQSLCDQLRADAVAKQVSLSDIVRTHIEANEVKPLGNPRPQRRPKKLKPVSGADPELLRHLAAIGNNVNQIAVVVNRGNADFTKAELLLVMDCIERHLAAIGANHAH